MADLIAIGYPDEAIAFGGTVLKTSLSQDDEKDLQAALHSDQTTAQ